MKPNFAFGRSHLMAVGSVALLMISKAAFAAVVIATVPVGNAGNPADSSGFGQVNYNYSIDKYDVTASQYATFLNAVAATDTYGAYNSSMLSGFAACGIQRSGSPGSYTYSTTKDPALPANYVNYWNACRFTNWLANGQPNGLEGTGTTETGTYTLTSTGMANNTITRNANSVWAVTSENEWYKAAYYNPANSTYWTYATQSNSKPSNVLSATGTNNANYYDGSFTDGTNYLTAVGAFASSSSAYGTYDQSGDVSDWVESITGGTNRILRGGSYFNDSSMMQSSFQYNDNPASDANTYRYGFRVSAVPEPTTLGLVAALSGIGLSRRTKPRK